MKRFGVVSTAVLFCLVGPIALAYAQQDQQEEKQTKHEEQSQITRYGVTGCLQEGRDANEYHLIGENAKWRLQSDKVRLADHVGHKVKVNGVVSNQPFHGMKEDLKAEVQKNPTETGVLTVTNLETVSDVCN